MQSNANTTKSAVESSHLLSEIASDFNKDEDTSVGVTEKPAESVNKRFLTPLGEEKVKENMGQYLH